MGLPPIGSIVYHLPLVSRSVAPTLLHPNPRATRTILPAIGEDHEAIFARVVSHHGTSANVREIAGRENGRTTAWYANRKNGRRWLTDDATGNRESWRGRYRVATAQVPGRLDDDGPRTWTIRAPTRSTERTNLGEYRVANHRGTAWYSGRLMNDGTTWWFAYRVPLPKRALQTIVKGRVAKVTALRAIGRLDNAAKERIMRMVSRNGSYRNNAYA